MTDQPAPRSDARSPQRSIWDRIPQAVSVGLVAAALVAVWHVAVARGWVSEFVLPAPRDVGAALWDIGQDILTGGTSWSSLWATLREIVAGLAIAAVLGIGLGIVSAETAFGRRVLQPFLVAFYAAPKVALAPIFVAWLGFGIWPKVVMAAVIAFFPLLVDTAAGLAAVETDQERLFRVMRASRRQTFLKLKWFVALPYVFAGLKSAAVLVVIGAVVGEFLGGGVGLGALIKISSSRLAMDRVFAYVLILALVAYVLFAAVSFAERRIVHWRRSRGVVEL